MPLGSLSIRLSGLRCRRTEGTLWESLTPDERPSACRYRVPIALRRRRLVMARRNQMAGELDPNLVDATPAEFDAQMEILARYFTPVNIEQIIAARHGGALPANAAIV